jgi:hypothetical protein
MGRHNRKPEVINAYLDDDEVFGEPTVDELWDEYHRLRSKPYARTESFLALSAALDAEEVEEARQRPRSLFARIRSFFH